MAPYAPMRHPEGSQRDIAEALVRADYGLRVASSRWILTTVNFDFRRPKFSVATRWPGR